MVTRKLPACQRRAALKELGINLPARPSHSHLCGSGADGQSAFSDGMLPTEGTSRNSLGASERSSMWKRGARRLTLRRSTSSLSQAAFGIAGQSDADRPARRVGGHFGDVRDQPKVADAARSCCRTSSEKTRALPLGVRRRKPSAGRPGRAGIIFEVRGKRGSLMQGRTAAQRLAWTRTQLSIRRA